MKIRLYEPYGTGVYQAEVGAFGWDMKRISTNRSPGGPPQRPGPPSPRTRKRLPSLTPAGTQMVKMRSTWSEPCPLQR